jgi:hypothetical protein
MSAARRPVCKAFAIAEALDVGPASEPARLLRI